MSSFDDTFDYTKSVAALKSANASDQKNLSLIQAELDDYSSAGSTWSGITQNRVTMLKAEKERVNNNINLRNETINELNGISSLSTANKNILMVIYNATGDSAQSFATRIPFNAQAALNDPDVVRLVNDTTLTPQVKGRLVQILYARYPMNVAHGNSLMEVRRSFMTK